MFSILLEEANIIKEEIIKVNFKKIFCGICQRKEATRCCDFVVGYSPAMFDEFKSALEMRGQKMWGDGGVQHELCDYPLCDECSKKNSYYLGVDFCPYHAFGELHRKDKPHNYSEKRGEWLNQIVLGIENCKD